MALPEEHLRRPDPRPSLPLFGEEIGGEQPLPEVLAAVQERLHSLALKYGAELPPVERFEILDSALDELDTALELVREARAKLLRIELRLASAYENGLARFREAARDAGTDA